MIKQLASTWNSFVHSVVNKWTTSDWGNSASDWKPVFFISIVVLIAAVILFFVFLALTAQGVVHSFCFWTSWSLLKFFVIYFASLFIYRFGWSEYVSRVLWIDQNLQHASTGALIIIGLSASFVFIGIFAWIIKQILNGLCPLPSRN